MKTTTNTELRSVESMFVSCSLQVRNFNLSGVAMSDCCRKPALTAVTMPTGANMWRCDEHRGVQRLDPRTMQPKSMGEVVSHVHMKKREV